MVIGTKIPGESIISEPEALGPAEAEELAMPEVGAVPVAAIDVTLADAGGAAVEGVWEDAVLEVTQIAEVSRKTVVAPLEVFSPLDSSVLVVALTTATGSD